MQKFQVYENFGKSRNFKSMKAGGNVGKFQVYEGCGKRRNFKTTKAGGNVGIAACKLWVNEMVHGLNIAKITERILPTVTNYKEAAARLWPPKPPLPKYTYKQNLECGGNLRQDKWDNIVQSSQV